MAYRPNDHFARKAKREQYAARSVYKLEELDRKHRILKPGFRVLDLGASPGSWSQYASRMVGDSGRVTGVDLKPVSITLPNTSFIQAGIGEWPESERPGWMAGPYDVVLSDMAPATTGNRVTDQARSLELCQLALSAAESSLRPNGHFVCKIFESGDMMEFHAELKSAFASVHLHRPKSVRKGSTEIFMVGMQYQKQ